MRILTPDERDELGQKAYEGDRDRRIETAARPCCECDEEPGVMLWTAPSRYIGLRCLRRIEGDEWERLRAMRRQAR